MVKGGLWLCLNTLCYCVDVVDISLRVVVWTALLGPGVERDNSYYGSNFMHTSTASLMFLLSPDWGF